MWNKFSKFKTWFVEKSYVNFFIINYFTTQAMMDQSITSNSEKLSSLLSNHFCNELNKESLSKTDVS